ncbi:MAG: sugar transferase [Spirochaetales bacterium]|nr:sugar transferase [Spirochaetales bacterium]
MYRIIKRLCDIVLSLIGLVVLFPVFLLISVLIKMDSKGPVFFWHKRVGYNNKDIKICKFRSMYNNAEAMINSFDGKVKEEWLSNYKLENDPRITRVGKILRKTSLDELPQLYDILVGKLSIVGPRPVIRDELNAKWTKEEQKKLLSVKPGLTGYWASHGRSNTTYEERVNLELYYVDNASLWMDIKIIFGTIPSILSKKGAK